MLKGEIQSVEPPKQEENKKTDAVMADTAKKAVTQPLDKTEPEFICRFQALPKENKYPKDSITKISVLQVNPVLADTAQQTNEIKSTNTPVTSFVARPEDIVSTIYPNPAGTYATVYCNRQTTYKVELFDEKGALKLSKSFYGDRTDLDVSGFARGHYFVQVRDDEGHKNVMKLVKQ
jgi:hypothetical protein